MLNVTMVILSTIYFPICNLTCEGCELGTSYKKSLLNHPSTMAMSLMRKSRSRSAIGQDLAVGKR